MDARTEEITCLLKAWGSGDEGALARLTFYNRNFRQTTQYKHPDPKDDYTDEKGVSR